MANGDDIGIYAELQERKARIAAHNPHLAEKLGAPKPKAGVEPIVVKPIFDKGRYVPMHLASLIAFVATQTDLHPDAITGNGRSRRLVDARSCIAVLAMQFAPRLSARAVDHGLLRGEGTTIWHRARHLDRIKLYPEYGALYARLLAALLERRP